MRTVDADGLLREALRRRPLESSFARCFKTYSTRKDRDPRVYQFCEVDLLLFELRQAHHDRPNPSGTCGVLQRLRNFLQPYHHSLRRQNDWHLLEFA